MPRDQLVGVGMRRFAVYAASPVPLDTGIVADFMVLDGSCDGCAAPGVRHAAQRRRAVREERITSARSVMSMHATISC